MRRRQGHLMGERLHAGDLGRIIEANKRQPVRPPRHRQDHVHQPARLEPGKEHGPDAPPFDVVKVNLQRVVSLPGFIGCIHDAMVNHPVKHVRRAAQRQIAALENEIGFDIKVIKGTVRSAPITPAESAETLHAQLLTLRSLSDHLVVI
jgi:hypothetical protein